MMDSIPNSEHSLSAQGMTCNPSHHLRRVIFLIWNEMISLETRFESLNWNISVGWSRRSAAKMRRTFHRNSTRDIHKRDAQETKVRRICVLYVLLGFWWFRLRSRWLRWRHVKVGGDGGGWRSNVNDSARWRAKEASSARCVPHPLALIIVQLN